jgi:hypothetical protein
VDTSLGGAVQNIAFLGSHIERKAPPVGAFKEMLDQWILPKSSALALSRSRLLP